MDTQRRVPFASVPAVAVGPRIVEILAMTKGETGGDGISMSWLGETTSARRHDDPIGVRHFSRPLRSKGKALARIKSGPTYRGRGVERGLLGRGARHTA